MTTNGTRGVFVWVNTPPEVTAPFQISIRSLVDEI